MRVILSVLLSLVLASAAAAEKRAFIVGVGAYDELTDLQKTVGDADGYRSLFGNELGYTVSTAPNAKKRRDFVAAFDEFVRSVSPGDEVVFVFSGHGWSDGAENYLSFSDAPRGVSEAVLRSETIALKQDVMARLRARGPKVLLAIIDACRDENYDPLTKSTGALEKGIVRISANEGELILYSAAQGQTSLDRLSNDDPSEYSVFTRVLLPRLRDTSKPLSRIANETRAEVQRLASTISHPQRPEMMMGIDLDFCLSGNCAARRALPPAPEFDPVAEAAAWERAKAGDVPELLTYLSVYPDGPNADMARTLITMKSGFVTKAAEKMREASPQPTVTTGAANPAASPARYAVGSTFRDTLSGGGEGPEMVVVPAGSFPMGSPSSEAGRGEDEDDTAGAGGRQHAVTIAKPFAVGKFEVTWAEWETCVADGGCDGSGPEGAGGDNGWGKGNRPVIEVDWNDAKAYVRWLSRKTGETYRLLSEAEWEYVARAGTTTAYWWGNQASHDYANYGKDQCCGGLATGRDRWENTAPVGSFSANVFGLHNLHGNVSEWTEDCWNGSYSGAPDDGSAWLSGNCDLRVLRGGSWDDGPQYLRSALRSRYTATGRFDNIGFRIARTL